ncbi:MAG: rod shape-determining protein RodA [Armatimonadota bacterium]|nr:MAG: rod shape-determining protein RodA [Armatimonadota bacterium]
MFERRLLRNLDWPLLGAALALALYGLAMIYSASFTNRAATGGDPLFFVKRQSLWLGGGLIAAAVFAYVEYQWFARLHRLIYVSILVGLGAVVLWGNSAGGAARWISIGAFRLQPSEFAKIALIITLAAFLQRYAGKVTRVRTESMALLHVALPALLIAFQPDLGTALVLVALWFVMLFLAGARKLHLALVGVAMLVLFAGAWQFDLLRPYQKARLAIFLDPGVDPLGSGYHIIQSKIAVGSGQVWGKGYLDGTQSQLHFIPAQHTDFIFTVVGEELGFVGAIGLLALYLVLLWRALWIMDRADDTFGMLLAGGVAVMFATQILVNVGMTMNVMPITGLPLPFMSYGGSSLVASMMAVGLLLNVGMRRQRIRF